MFTVAVPLTSRQLVRPVRDLRFPLGLSRPSMSEGRVDRRACLRQQLSFLASGWEQLSDRLSDYVAAVPRKSGYSHADVLDCLQWLRGNCALTSQQLDHWLCQQALCLLAQRREALRHRCCQFASLSSRSKPGAAEGVPRPGNSAPQWIAANPLRHWVLLSTSALLHGSARPPANVLLYVAEREVRAAAFGLEGLALFNSLVDHEPCLLGDWAREVTLAGIGLLEDFCRDLADLGLVAIGPPLVGV